MYKEKPVASICLIYKLLNMKYFIAYLMSKKKPEEPTLDVFKLNYEDIIDKTYEKIKRRQYRNNQHKLLQRNYPKF